MTADQLNAFVSNSGFEPTALATFLLGSVFVALLLWGVWAMHSAYVGWADNSIGSRGFFLVVVRFIALYVVLSFLLLS